MDNNKSKHTHWEIEMIEKIIEQNKSKFIILDDYSP